MMKFWKIENMIVDILKSSGFWLILCFVSFISILCYGCKQDKISQNRKKMEKKMIVECVKSGNFTNSCKILISKQFDFTVADLKEIEKKTAN